MIRRHYSHDYRHTFSNLADLCLGRQTYLTQIELISRESCCQEADQATYARSWTKQSEQSYQAVGRIE